MTADAARVVAALSKGRRGEWWREARRNDARVALMQSRGLVPLPFDPVVWVPLLRGSVPLDATAPMQGMPTGSPSTGGAVTFWTVPWAVWALREAIESCERSGGSPTWRAAELLAMGEDAVAAMTTVKALKALDE